MQTGKEITLPSGNKVTIDLNRVSIAEYRRMFDREQSNEEEAAVLAKILGEDVSDKAADYIYAIREFVKYAKDPFAQEANSPSESTSA